MTDHEAPPSNLRGPLAGSRSEQSPRVLSDTVPRRSGSKRVDASAERFGRYLLLERLGEEDITEVYRARVDGPEGFEKTCALERLRSEILDDEAAVARFVERARLASTLHHPNLVEIYDFGVIERHPYVAREYVDGVPLSGYLDWCHAQGTPPPLPLALYITGELCRALAYLQGLTGSEGSPQPVTHGNLIPSSILLGRQGTLKLTHFSPAPDPSQGDLAAVARLCHTVLLGRDPTPAEAEDLSGVAPQLAAVLRRALTGQLDPDGLQDGILDYGFDADVRVSDWALTESMRRYDGVDDVPIERPNTRPLGSPKPAAGEETYRVQSGAGSRLGAISKSNFVSMLQSDALAATAMVSVDGHPYQALADLPVYRETVRELTTPPVSSFNAMLNAETLPSIAAKIGTERLTGCLRVQRGEALKQFWFRRGVPVHSTSTADEELLGPSMVRAGLIDDAALKAARGVMQAEGGLLGEVLLRHGLCSASALHRGLEEQLRQRFQALLEWSSGHLSFIEGLEPVGEVLRMSYDATQLVTEMTRRCYDEGRLFGLLQPYLDATISFQSEGSVTHDNLRLNGRELRQFGRLTEGMSLREQLQPLAGQATERATFLQVVFLLHSAKILVFSGALTKPRGTKRR